MRPCFKKNPTVANTNTSGRPGSVHPHLPALKPCPHPLLLCGAAVSHCDSATQNTKHVGLDQLGGVQVTVAKSRPISFADWLLNGD